MGEVKLGADKIGKIYLGDINIVGGVVNNLKLTKIAAYNLYVINNTDRDIQIKDISHNVIYDVVAGSVFTINSSSADSYQNIQQCNALTTSIANTNGSMVGTINAGRILYANTTFLQVPVGATGTVYILNIVG